MANIKTEVRKQLVNGVAAQAGVIEAEKLLNEKRDGMYTCGIKAAIAAKKREVFLDVITTLENDFRFNRRGIAVKYNVPQAKQAKTGAPKTDADGNPVYTVPSALRTMKSYVLSGFDHNVDFGTASNPTPFSVVRTAVQAAKEAAVKAARTPDDEQRDAIKESLAAIAEYVDSIEGKRALNAAMKLIQETGKALTELAA